MDKELRIIELEREINDTRKAAVHMILGMAQAIAPSAEGRADLAVGFREAAEACDDPVTARLARLVALALIKM